MLLQRLVAASKGCIAVRVTFLLSALILHVSSALLLLPFVVHVSPLIDRLISSLRAFRSYRPLRRFRPFRPRLHLCRPRPNRVRRKSSSFGLQIPVSSSAQNRASFTRPKNPIPLFFSWEEFSHDPKSDSSSSCHNSFLPPPTQNPVLLVSLKSLSSEIRGSREV